MRRSSQSKVEIQYWLALHILSWLVNRQLNLQINSLYLHIESRVIFVSTSFALYSIPDEFRAALQVHSIWFFQINVNCFSLAINLQFDQRTWSTFVGRFTWILGIWTALSFGSIMNKAKLFNLNTFIKTKCWVKQTTVIQVHK